MKRLTVLLAIALILAAVVWMVLGIIDRTSKHEDEWAKITTARMEQRI